VSSRQQIDTDEISYLCQIIVISREIVSLGRFMRIRAGTVTPNQLKGVGHPQLIALVTPEAQSPRFN
jgi:hypothetical protein